MIELYTSEGCSSCPPAERYLNQLTKNPLLWKKFIPLAFHVDYWDYLGWRDKYASPRYTARQKQHAAINAARTIYTPGFFVNGRSWRAGFFNSLPSPETPIVGELRVRFKSGHIEANFEPAGKSINKRDLELHVALLGMGLKTNIQAGENEGRISQHEFVVLEYGKLDGTRNQWNGKLPTTSTNSTKQLALVAWVSQIGQPAPVQATGGYITLSKK